MKKIFFNFLCFCIVFFCNFASEELFLDIKRTGMVLKLYNNMRSAAQQANVSASVLCVFERAKSLIIRKLPPPPPTQVSDNQAVTMFLEDKTLCIRELL